MNYSKEPIRALESGLQGFTHRCVCACAKHQKGKDKPSHRASQ